MTKKKTKKTTAKKDKACLSAPIYLLVVDSSDEFQVALGYATKLAQAHGARLALLHALDKEGFFQQWGGVQERLHEEYRIEAEQELLAAAMMVNERSAVLPVVYLEEAENLTDKILSIVNEDPNIKKLILGGAAGVNNPGPLVSYFSGKGLNKLTVPLTVVPGSLSEDALERLI